MEKIKNFKAKFSNLLETKYKMNKEDINDYWQTRKEVDKYEGKRKTAIAVGLGEAIGTAGFAIWDVAASNADCMIPVTIFGSVAFITIASAILKPNPYTKEEYEEIDEKYEYLRSKAKKINKKANRR